MTTSSPAIEPVFKMTHWHNNAVELAAAATWALPLAQLHVCLKVVRDRPVPYANSGSP